MLTVLASSTLAAPVLFSNALRQIYDDLVANDTAEGSILVDNHERDSNHRQVR